MRTAYNGTEECIRRIDECLAIYRSIRAGTNPEAAAQVTMSDTEIDRMLCRYSRRAQFLRTGLAAAAHGDHEGAELALLVLCTDDSGAAFPDLAVEHRVPDHLRADLLRHRAVRRRPPRAVGSVVGEGDRSHRPARRRRRPTTICWSRAPPDTAASASKQDGLPKPSRGCGGRAPAPKPGDGTWRWPIAIRAPRHGLRPVAARVRLRPSVPFRCRICHRTWRRGPADGRRPRCRR